MYTLCIMPICMHVCVSGIPRSCVCVQVYVCVSMCVCVPAHQTLHACTTVRTCTLLSILCLIISVRYLSLKLALRYVHEALKHPPNSKMYLFGMAALEKFKNRLKEFPQFCKSVAAIPHFHQIPLPLRQVHVCTMYMYNHIVSFHYTCAVYISRTTSHGLSYVYWNDGGK